MTKASLDIYRQHLKVDLSAVYDNTEANRQDSAIYYIDAVYLKSFPDSQALLLWQGRNHADQPLVRHFHLLAAEKLENRPITIRPPF